MSYHVANKKNNYQARLDSYEREMRLRMQGRMREKSTKLQMYMQQLAVLNPKAKLEKNKEKLAQYQEKLRAQIGLRYKEYEHRFRLQLTRLHGNAPTAKLVGGFGYLESTGKPVMSAGQMQAGTSKFTARSMKKLLYPKRITVRNWLIMTIPRTMGRLGTRTIPKARIMNEIYQQPL